MATEGLTRFEDRNRLPLGISVNLNSFSAKMLAQVRRSGSSAAASFMHCASCCNSVAILRQHGSDHCGML